MRRCEVEVGRELIECALSELQPVEIRLVEGEAECELWEQLISRHHYLGFHSNRGRKLRYLVCARDRIIGAIGWKSGSLRLESRDCFIGWSSEQRRQYLAHVLNNDRFLILDGVRVKNLASHVLGRNVRMAREDWYRRYGVRPYVLETFIDPMFSGACYRAAGWKHVGKTKGYAKLHGGYRYHGRITEFRIIQ